jgi:hypothetical protein
LAISLTWIKVKFADLQIDLTNKLHTLFHFLFH